MNAFKPRGIRRCHCRWLYFAVFILIILIIWACVPVFHSMEILIGSLTLISGAFYFFNQWHIEKARFFKELVTEFNRRYDEKNNVLLSILETREPLDKKQKESLIDYFNLCAEEYLFYEEGYIYPEVWGAWYNGMKQFGGDHRVSKLWQQEVKSDSYYGFEFPIS
jgi:hypothetical protein